MVYFDGNNGDNERTAQYTIGTESITGVDAAGADFHKTPNNNYEYRLVDPVTNVGNYMVFSGVEGESFTLNAEGIAGNLMRAAIQGIQIVGDANVIVPGDATGDGMVELDNYMIIRDNFRQLVTSRGMGDLSGDGQVNFVDFLEWRNSASEAVLAQFAAYGQQVPEPAAWAIASLGVVLLGYSRWRR